MTRPQTARWGSGRPLISVRPPAAGDQDVPNTHIIGSNPSMPGPAQPPRTHRQRV